MRKGGLRGCELSPPKMLRVVAKLSDKGVGLEFKVFWKSLDILTLVINSV